MKLSQSKLQLFLFNFLLLCVTVSSMGQDGNCISRILNSKNDSLFRSTEDYIINAKKYEELNRSSIIGLERIDSMFKVIKRSTLTEEEQKILADLIGLSTNEISDDVYSKAKTLDQGLVVKFNEYISMVSLYTTDRKYAKMRNDFGSWMSKICRFVNRSVDYYNADNEMVSDSVFLSEVKQYGFNANDVIADIGAGSGYFEIVLSKFCDSLQVYTTDIDAALIANLTT